MNRKPMIAACIALAVGLAGGIAVSYSWPRLSHDEDILAREDEHGGHGHESKDSRLDHTEHDEHAGHDHAEEDVVRLSDKDRNEFNIEVATAGSGSLKTHISLPGEIVLNADRLAHIVPRAPGIVREVLTNVGDTVRAGEVMAWIESADLGDAKVDYLAKWAALSCCTIDLTRAQEVHDNTIKLLEMLESSPSLEKLREMNGIAMGDNRTTLVSAYAEFVFAKAAYLREKPLFEKKVASERDYQAAASAFKKADALYTATRDSISFKIRRNLLEAKRAQQVREIELKGAERRLYVMGLTSEDIHELELLARSQTSLTDDKPACDDPNCKDCARTASNDRNVADGDVRKADEKLAWYPLRAPFGGTVIEKHLTLGEKHGDDSGAFTIADLNSVWIDISVYQKDLPYVKKGQGVQISAGANGITAQGVIAYVAPLVDQKTRTAVARMVLSNPDGTWRPGLFVKARIPVGQDNAAIVIPKTAVQRMGEKTVVFIDTDEGFKPAPISLGRSNATHVEVLSGLRVGQRFVIRGGFELKAKIVTSELGAHAGHGH